jgi:hypothetical protein
VDVREMTFKSAILDKPFLFASLAHLKNAGKALTADRSTTELRWINFFLD